VFPSFVILFNIWFSPDTPVPSINKTDRHDITELLFNHHKPNQTKPSIYKSKTASESF